MIVYRRWEKKCNICKKVVAIKDFLFFKTLCPYVPINMEIDGITGNAQIEMHICEKCWMKLKERIEVEVAEDG